MGAAGAYIGQPALNNYMALNVCLHGVYGKRGMRKSFVAEPAFLLQWHRSNPWGEEETRKNLSLLRALHMPLGDHT